MNVQIRKPNAAASIFSAREWEEKLGGSASCYVLLKRNSSIRILSNKLNTLMLSSFFSYKFKPKRDSIATRED